MGIGSNLWSWQRAQPIVWARNDLAQGVDLLVDDVHAELLLVLLFEVGVAEDEEAGGNCDGGGGRSSDSAGRRSPASLLAGELVEGHVVVEGVDDDSRGSARPRRGRARAG